MHANQYTKLEIQTIFLGIPFEESMKLPVQLPRKLSKNVTSATEAAFAKSKETDTQKKMTSTWLPQLAHRAAAAERSSSLWKSKSNFLPGHQTRNADYAHS